MLLYSTLKMRLAQGQLKNTAAVCEDISTSEITKEQESTILNLTNQGLLDLSTRLPIVKKRVRLTFQNGVNIYTLTNINNGVYLSELDGIVFDEKQLVRIYELHDELGKLHSHDTKGHIQTMSYNSLRFTDDKIIELGAYTNITYQAKYDILEGVDVEHEIDIPPSLELPLQLFIASLFFSHMNGDQSAKGDSYFGSYLRHIGENIQDNKANTSEVGDTSDRFIYNGFI